MKTALRGGTPVTSAVDFDLSLLSRFSLGSVVEWRSVCTARHNLLLEGSATSADAVLRLLEPYLREPLMRRRPHTSLDLPSGELGTLILHDVGSLGSEEQTRLLRWLDDASQTTQVVSTTAESLFSLVARGLFNGALYFRLN